MLNKSRIVLFTAGYPYGFGESFLENEIPFLAKAFEEIIIVPKNPKNTSNCRAIPSNCKIRPLYFHDNKISALLPYFNWSILKAILHLLPKKNFIPKVKVLFDQLSKATNTVKVLEEICQEGVPKIAYSYWLDDSAIAFALVKKTYPNTKFVSRAHGWDVYFERHPYNYLPLRAFLAQNLDDIFFISGNGLTYFRSISGVPNNFGTIGRLGTLGTKVNTNKTSEKTTLTIVSCSAVIPLKRIHLIAEALKIAKFPFHWYHIGDGKLMEEVKCLANESLPNNQFTFLGQMNNKEVLDFYKTNDIDLLLNVSSTEGIPVSMMEALSFGIPCIGTNVGGVSELIQNGTNGYLIEANPNPRKVAESLTRHYKLTTEQKIEMRKASYDFWLSTFNADKNYPAFIEAISNL